MISVDLRMAMAVSQQILYVEVATYNVGVDQQQSLRGARWLRIITDLETVAELGVPIILLQELGHHLSGHAETLSSLQKAFPDYDCRQDGNYTAMVRKSVLGQHGLEMVTEHAQLQDRRYCQLLTLRKNGSVCLQAASLHIQAGSQKTSHSNRLKLVAGAMWRARQSSPDDAVVVLAGDFNLPAAEVSDVSPHVGGDCLCSDGSDHVLVCSRHALLPKSGHIGFTYQGGSDAHNVVMAAATRPGEHCHSGCGFVFSSRLRFR